MKKWLKRTREARFQRTDEEDFDSQRVELGAGQEVGVLMGE